MTTSNSLRIYLRTYLRTYLSTYVRTHVRTYLLTYLLTYLPSQGERAEVRPVRKALVQRCEALSAEALQVERARSIPRRRN